MSTFKLVTIDQRFFAETIARTGSEQLLEKASRSYIGIYNEEINWYIPLRARLSLKKPKGTYYPTPFKTDNPHFKRPGLDFEKSIFVPKHYVITIQNTLPKDQFEFIEKHQKDIKEQFENYVLSVEQLDKKSVRYFYSTVTLFPDGIERIKKLQKAKDVILEDRIISKAEYEKIEEGKKDVQTIIQNKDIKGLSKHLKDGIKEYLKSDTFKKYLDFVAQFHHYSDKNIRLLLSQKKDVSTVAGFQKWKELGRTIKKGSKALYVYAPSIRILKDETGQPLLDEYGQKQTKTYFYLTPVFDVSQTEGKELPQPIYRLKGEFQNQQEFYHVFQGIASLTSATIQFDTFGEELKNGSFSPSQNLIYIQKGLGQEMTIKTLIHEAVHSRLHTDSQRYQKDKAKMEFEAESIAYIVSKHLGIHTDDYSFAYLSSWTKQGKLIEEFTESLQRISSEAQQMIQQLDQYFEKHKGLSKEQPQNKFEERLAKVNNKTVDYVKQSDFVNKISTEGGNSVKK